MGRISPTKYTVRAAWEDVPHLTAAQRLKMMESCPPHLRLARSQGLPTVGIGRVYPMSWELVKETPFSIPEHWPRTYTLDPHWSRTAALWFAIDKDNDVWHFYGEYYEREMAPHLHALAIKQRGEWMRGTADPASLGSGQEDGKRLIDAYRRAGLRLTPGTNPVESGIAAVWTRMRERRLRVFETLTSFRYEFNQYHRDENGRIVKRNDHLMDCLRYAASGGYKRACTKEDVVRPAGGYRGWAADSRAGF